MALFDKLLPDFFDLYYCNDLIRDTDLLMKVGVIGLGTMGSGMARNFYRAGLLHRIWNRTVAIAERFAAEMQVQCAASAAALAAACELIVLSVSRDADVLEVVAAISKTISKDSIVIDTSTVGADTAKKAASILKKAGAYFLDCPVSGGAEGAQRGDLAMMVGGERAVLERAHTALGAIAKRIVYIGPTGSGQATKAVNQVMAAGINQAVTEALAFGAAMDLDMDKVLDVVSNGAAANWFLDHRGKTMLAGEYKPGFKLALHHKDLEICKEMIGMISKNSLPIVEMSLIHYQKLIKQGYGAEDISALFRLKRDSLCKNTT